MLLSSPIFEKNIDMIMDLMLEFYYNDNTFMLNVWNSLIKIASIEEKNESINIEKISNIHNLVEESKKNLNKFC